ncbi:MAG: hypothetical protein LBQ58_04440 [Synergistaceae bacterium]|nr:hypothetical protein [Synergistaceae bacterium]
MKKCSRCHNKLSWDREYCPICGGKIVDVPNEDVVSTKENSDNTHPSTEGPGIFGTSAGEAPLLPSPVQADTIPQVPAPQATATPNVLTEQTKTIPPIYQNQIPIPQVTAQQVAPTDQAKTIPPVYQISVPQLPSEADTPPDQDEATPSIYQIPTPQVPPPPVAPTDQDKTTSSTPEAPAESSATPEAPSADPADSISLPPTQSEEVLSQAESMDAIVPPALKAPSASATPIDLPVLSAQPEPVNAAEISPALDEPLTARVEDANAPTRSEEILSPVLSDITEVDAISQIAEAQDDAKEPTAGTPPQPKVTETSPDEAAEVPEDSPTPQANSLTSEEQENDDYTKKIARGQHDEPPPESEFLKMFPEARL